LRANTSINILLTLLAAVIFFHLAVLAKVIPYNIAWGGRLHNDHEMYVFEFLSILINVFLALVLLMKGDFIKLRFKQKTTETILWIFFILFLLNTVGNLFATRYIEKAFAVLTLVFAILIFTILKSKNKSRSS
jgi:FtsH-binding integral membrane protein